jgi:hypothetical protein
MSVSAYAGSLFPARVFLTGLILAVQRTSSGRAGMLPLNNGSRSSDGMLSQMQVRIVGWIWKAVRSANQGISTPSIPSAISESAQISTQDQFTIGRKAVKD